MAEWWKVKFIASEGRTKEEVKCILFPVTFGLSTLDTDTVDSCARGKRHDEFVKSQTSAAASYFYKERK